MLKEFEELFRNNKELNRKVDLILQKVNINHDPLSDWYDLQDVCQRLKISKRTVFNYISQGILEGVHLAGSKKLFFLKNDVEKLLSAYHSK